jgi:hypothetical protein
VNEYTRREEVRWTLISSFLLVVCIAPAVLMLVSAKGKLVPDPTARMAAKLATDRVTQAHTCETYAERLGTEVDVFKQNAKAARLGDPAADADAGAPVPKKPPKRGAPKEKEPDVSLAWPAAQPSVKQAKLLASCRMGTETLTGAKADVAAAWEAVATAAAVAPSDDPAAKIDAARKLLKTLGDAPLEKILQQTKDAEAAAKAESDKATAIADAATIREPIPEGIIARRLAVGIGVGISVIALVISYISVRVSSMRRLATLVPLRERARAGQPGPHAAAVLSLASKFNGGEPGLVIGGAVGGLAAAALLPSDTDLFIAGVMGGLLIGLAMQWAVRFAIGPSRWRARATELAEIEKPAIPIVLVLSGVNLGLEGPFIKFFNGLTPEDAAHTVAKLAAQAEERILAAADAAQAAR